MKAVTWADKLKKRFDVTELDIPPGGQLLWEWFLQLDRTRAFTEVGAATITYAEIAAWRALSRFDVQPWEVEVLRRMDDARVLIWNTKKPKDEPDRIVSMSDSEGIKQLLRGAWKGD